MNIEHICNLEAGCVFISSVELRVTKSSRFGCSEQARLKIMCVNFFQCYYYLIYLMIYKREGSEGFFRRILVVMLVNAR